MGDLPTYDVLALQVVELREQVAEQQAELTDLRGRMAAMEALLAAQAPPAIVLPNNLAWNDLHLKVQRVLTILAQAQGQRLRTVEIARAMGATRAATNEYARVKTILLRMARRGMIAKDGRGTYRLIAPAHDDS